MPEHPSIIPFLESEDYRTISDIVQAFAQQLRENGDFLSILHANKLMEYHEMITDSGFLTKIKDHFDQIYLICKELGILFSIDGRRKALESLNSKIILHLKKNASLDLIRDIFAFRIVIFDAADSILSIAKCYEAMQKDFASQPKYGNNIPEVDEMVAEVYKLHADTCLSLPCVYGDSLKPNAISISAHQPGGAVTGATPDGRKGGTILADASLSPDHGTDTHGPLAVLQSAMRVDQDPYQGTLMNMKFHPSAMKTEEDLKKLASMIKIFLTHGGKHIQFNVVDREEMEDAKVHPDDHSELVVRVAGYSAYFTRLTPAIQDEVIERMEHDLQ